MKGCALISSHDGRKIKRIFLRLILRLIFAMIQAKRENICSMDVIVNQG